jgi:hypothetical protein
MFLTLSSIGALILGRVLWLREIAIADDMYDRTEHYLSYLHQYRPCTLWMLTHDPDGLGLVVLGVAVLALRGNVRARRALAAVSWLAAFWYLGCGCELLFRPLI